MNQSIDRLKRLSCPSPKEWKVSTTHTENSLHQLSPYIGKLKSRIAKDLVQVHSKPGELVVDPFSGSGTIPLEAHLLGRKVFACDISPYAHIITKAKLMPPPTLSEAIKKAESIIEKASYLPAPDLRKVPKWVRCFFNPKTLKEAISFTKLCNQDGNEFFLACFLGILHHQRPGFLSYPSSHLVPYLRNRKFPKNEFPEFYEYREIKIRLLQKIKRTYKRFCKIENPGNPIVKLSSIENVSLPKSFDCLITSPPYMNALDYIRDNRLRLWFINQNENIISLEEPTRTKEIFKKTIASMARKIETSLKPKGNCVLIVGERVAKSNQAQLSKLVIDIMEKDAPSLLLSKIIKDKIPNIRRSRRDCRGIKAEHILIFKKRK